ncbi:hypothetical protein [Kaarinaea lacus]
MENIQKIRLLIGAVASPLIIPLVVYITFVFVFGADADKDQEIQSRINIASWLSYAIALVLSVAAYFTLQKKQWYSVIHYLVAGTVVGFASWLLFSYYVEHLVSLLFFVFVIAGALVGGSYWLIAFFQPDGNYSNIQPSRRRRRRRSN